MEGILVKLKAFLNGLSDEELKEYELWINNASQVEIIAVDKNAITLITDTKMLKIDEKEW